MINRPHSTLSSRTKRPTTNTQITNTDNNAKTNKSKIDEYRRPILSITLPILVIIFTYYIYTQSSSSNLVQPHERIHPDQVSAQVVTNPTEHAQVLKEQDIKIPEETPQALQADDDDDTLKNIGDFMTEREKYKDYDMVIVYYSSLFGMPAGSSYLRHDVGDHTCNITDDITGQILYNQKVLLTDDRGLEKYSYSFVFHGPDSNGNNVRNKNEDGNDIYIYHNMESPAMTSISLTSEDSMKQFNLLMSYQFESEIFLPYVGRGTIKQLIDTPILLTFEEKTESGAPLAWVGSNCGAHNGRQDYLRELFKNVDTHSYGACLKTEGKSWPHGQSLKEIVKKYKFYIVMENSNCRDYITEKLGAAIISSTVPVVFSVNGIPNYDYYMPPHSYINAADYNSAKELGQYLQYVANNKTAYEEYLWYKHVDKDKEWENILERFQFKETANHWCRAANAVWNYYRNKKINGIEHGVKADNSCLGKSIMSQYIDRNEKKEE